MGFMSSWFDGILVAVLINAAVGTAGYLFCRVLALAAGHFGAVRAICPMYKSVLLFSVVPGILCYGRVCSEAGRAAEQADNSIKFLFYACYTFWAIGTAATFVNYVRKYRVYLQFRQDNEPLDDGRALRMLEECFPERDWKKRKLSRNCQLKSPCVMGMFCEEIVLPEAEYTDEELRTILMHEAMHIVRHDSFIKRIGLALVVVYWFNPVLRRYVEELEEWSETACDISVCLRFFQGLKRHYFQILYSVYLKGSELAPHPVLRCCRSDSLRRRIERIRKWKKR